MESRLDKEIKKWITDPYFDLNGVAVKGATDYLTVSDIVEIAKHFYEFGKNDTDEQSTIDQDFINKMFL